MAKEMNKIYQPSQVEDRIYNYWEENGYFKPEISDSEKTFTIIMPPPNVTGQLHMGHAFDETLQDVLVRYHRMLGDKTLWIPGMDHASIATEVKVVDEIKQKEGLTKEDLGREAFLERAWQWSDTYRDRIREQLKKLGTSCDWDRERFTMDKSCSDAVNQTFLKLYEDGKIYKGNRMINWCPDCQTALSDIEVEYEEQDGKLWYLKYPVEDSDLFLEVATTRPETMLGDTAVAVNPEDERYQDLIGKNVILPLMNRKIPIIADEYVDMEFGTGAVKITPAHDPNDYEVGKRHGLEEINIFNEDGTLNQKAGQYQNLERYEAREQVLKDLEELNLLSKIEDITHNVGTCYRCHTTIETMTSEQWFVAMKELAERALEAVANDQTRFVPERFTKVFNNWLENIKDWCISRQLWWGHRIPVYYCDECQEMTVSTEPVKTCPKCGSEKIRQDEDVFDTWFSSGLWPFSTLGWPEENEDLSQFYPNDVLVTGYDIIFFWVARMIFMSLFNTDQTPFSDVYIHGLIRDKDGRKMSKSLGNGIDPLQVIADYSADALRFAIITGNAAGNDVRMSDEKLEWGRNFLNKIWNASRFLLLNIPEDFVAPENVLELLEPADKWILTRMNELVGEVSDNMQKYELGLAAQKAYDFAWNAFCDWYIEFVKPRLYGDDQKSKEAAFYTLVTVLETILKLLHPVIPFITEEIYSYLPGEREALIISSWPEFDSNLVFNEEVEQVETLMQIIRAIRNIRANLDVSTGKKADLYIKEIDNAFDFVNENKTSLQKLANVGDVKVLPEDANLDLYATDAVSGIELYLLLDELVDREKEISRLEKEKKKLESDIAASDKKLSNPNFVNKAPEAVVEKEKHRKEVAQEKLEIIDKRLEIYKMN